MSKQTRAERVEAGRQLAALLRAKLAGMATLLLAGKSVKAISLDLRLVAQDVTREIGALVGATEEEIATWMPHDLKAHYDRAVDVLRDVSLLDERASGGGRVEGGG